MAWLYLVLVGICEIGWPVGLKLGWTDQGRPAMTASGALFLWAQRFIPMGTVYAVWTGSARSARSWSASWPSAIRHRPCASSRSA
jgi:multidrug transporter EmrE-like cation transporter